MRKYNFFWQVKELLLMQKKWKASKVRICPNIPLGAVHKLCCLKIGNFWSSPLVVFFKIVFRATPLLSPPCWDDIVYGRPPNIIAAWLGEKLGYQSLWCKSRLFYGHWAYGQIKWRPRRSYCQCCICCWIYGNLENLAEILKELLPVSKSCPRTPILKVPY